ncbi:Trifunctional nucleotide phosphoesterase protein YfkN precursor [Roseovarius litorisediminis]|uniref:Trifunctional nucleotide phosphoesterase protein YfkN n=1 Tax=Roseovarius litorisediminis TaxID=1312363 RepID=A0A1Y5TCK1_9RHOB|nr:Trifunctional nucleotide phosphoesterase protein YfkN precursor [Roseovarius litorisediminis]
MRLLETTDVHAHLLPFDYFSGQNTGFSGLACVATLIRQARGEVQNCLLFDSGDFLQGTPISDMTAQPGTGWTGPHPVLTAMNLLGYDAATPGNHEFNFGLNWLHETLSQASFPVTCANALKQSRDGAETLFPPYLILKRQVLDTRGNSHDLRIGVIGLLPPQITTWDQYHLQERVCSRDIVETAQTLVPQIRAAGADLVIALAHTGIDPATPFSMMENAALPLGAVAGIDAILAGHSHQIFPSSGFQGTVGIDACAATLNGTPAVMAGFGGSHLGVLDLGLEKGAQGWRVTHHRAQARTTQATPPDPAICAALEKAHQATVRLTGRSLGRTAKPLHSYLSLIRNDASVQLVTRAQRLALTQRLKGTEHEGLPVLSASAPFKTGGRAGPLHYSDVPPGDFLLRNAADLYAFPNTLCGLRLTGAQIRDWLERAAIIFNRITPGGDDQVLIDPAVPGHNFDVIDGLTYQIDLSQPARFDLSGNLIAASARRICDLCHAGKPVADKEEFIVATNNFRAFGGGPYPVLANVGLIHSGHRAIRDILAKFVSDHPDIPSDTQPIWTFHPMPGTSAVFETGPGIRRYPRDLAALNATDLGDSDAGFARFRLPL